MSVPKASQDFVLSSNDSSPTKTWTWKRNPRITIRERVNASGGIGYRVTVPASVTGGKVLFRQSRDFTAAQEIARNRGREFQESRSTALTLGDTEKIQAAAALQTLEHADVRIPLDQLAREYCDARAHLSPLGLSLAEGAKRYAEVSASAQRVGKSVDDLIQYGVQRLEPKGGNKIVADLAEEMIAIKRGWLARNDLRHESFRDFETRAGRIRKDLGPIPLPELTKDAIYHWLVGLQLAPRTVQNYRMVLAEMLRYAVQKNYLLSNPSDELTRHDIKQVQGRIGEMKQPAILTPTQAADLLAAAFRHIDLGLGAAVVLALFAGIRTEELKRLRWSAIRMDDPEPFVVIGPQIAKKRRIRNVPINETAMAWLRLWQTKVTVTPDSPVARNDHANDYQKRFQRLYTKAAIPWESNAMRHSFGSYHYAKHGNAMETARIMGHKTKGDAGDDVLFTHYRALTTRAVATGYFEILP